MLLAIEVIAVFLAAVSMSMALAHALEFRHKLTTPCKPSTILASRSVDLENRWQRSLR